MIPHHFSTNYISKIYHEKHLTKDRFKPVITDALFFVQAASESGGG